MSTSAFLIRQYSVYLTIMFFYFQKVIGLLLYISQKRQSQSNILTAWQSNSPGESDPMRQPINLTAQLNSSLNSDLITLLLSYRYFWFSATNVGLLATAPFFSNCHPHQGINRDSQMVIVCNCLYCDYIYWNTRLNYSINIFGLIQFFKYNLTFILV